MTLRQHFFATRADVPEFPDWSLNARFPQWPFANLNAACILEFDVVLSDMSDALVAELAEVAGDTHILAVALEPADWDSTGEDGPWVPAFRLPTSSPCSPSDLYFYDPNGEVAEAMYVRTNVLLVTGSTNRWAIWAQRDWEIGVLALARDLTVPPGISHRVLPLDTDLDMIRSPAGWGMPLPPALLAQLRDRWRPTPPDKVT